ncbi:MAG: hypothetical protein CMB48_06890 [Euryarchaeota archaeon]|nr:hypothetical protein [Euryarchaeota archaeon]|tara:strand:- start:1189 stop:1638 length:450 start_codon:yes stop_codon:yes gene_type:complete
MEKRKTAENISTLTNHFSRNLLLNWGLKIQINIIHDKPRIIKNVLIFKLFFVFGKLIVINIAIVKDIDGPIKKRINCPKSLDGDSGIVNGDIVTNIKPIMAKIMPIFCIFSGFLVTLNIMPNANIDIGNQNKSIGPGSDANANMYIGQS